MRLLLPSRAGVSYEEFQNLDLGSKKIMKNGILFIWVNKDVMSDVMNYTEKQGFTYIENFSIIQLSLNSCIRQIIELKKQPKKKPNTGNIFSYFQKLNSEPTEPQTTDTLQSVNTEQQPYIYLANVIISERAEASGIPILSPPCFK